MWTKQGGIQRMSLESISSFLAKDVTFGLLWRTCRTRAHFGNWACNNCCWSTGTPTCFWGSCHACLPIWQVIRSSMCGCGVHVHQLKGADFFYCGKYWVDVRSECELTMLEPVYKKKKLEQRNCHAPHCAVVLLSWLGASAQSRWSVWPLSRAGNAALKDFSSIRGKSRWMERWDPKGISNWIKPCSFKSGWK